MGTITELDKSLATRREQRLAEYRAIDEAVDEVLRELHDARRMTINSNPASNLRDGLVAGLMDRGFDIVRIDR